MGKKRKKGRRRSPAPLPARRSGSPSGDTFAPPVARESVSTIGELRPDPRNARRHGPRNVETIAAALAEVGAARSIVIDESGVILAGNATVEAAAQAGIGKVHVVDADGSTLVAVRRAGLTPQQKARLALFDNRSSELAEGWDVEKLRELEAANVSLGGLWSPDELEALYRAAAVEAGGGHTDPDEVPPERPTEIRAGDLFRLGDHRLLCGDSTRPEDIERLLAGARPLLMVTDPPYGMEYDPTWRNRAGVNKSTKKSGTVVNDDQADWTEVWRLFPGEVAYVWHGGLKASTVQASLELAGFALRAQIVWAKDRMALSRGDYHWQHEPCWYGVREGAAGRRTGDRSQTTLWRIGTPEAWLIDGRPIPETTTLWEIPAREDAGHGHGTQKPVECMARPMRNHYAPEVFEPFLGSGTTVIAGQMLGRRVYALELHPPYVQVAIDRWEAFTGQKAERLE
jgi:DNA modification methylase